MTEHLLGETRGSIVGVDDIYCITDKEVEAVALLLKGGISLVRALAETLNRSVNLYDANNYREVRNYIRKKIAALQPSE